MQIDHYVSERRRKQKKRRAYVLAVGLVVVGYLIVLGGILFILRFPWFQEEHIVITGNQEVSQAQIMDLLQANVTGHGFWKNLLGFDNMLVWPSSLPTSTISAIPQLSSLSIQKDYFSRTITVAVVERQPFAVWCFVSPGSAEQGSDSVPLGDSEAVAANASTTSGIAIAPSDNENCFWFDRQGTIFEPTLDTEGGATVVVHDYSGARSAIGGKVLPDEFIPNLISIVDAIKQSGLAVQGVALNDLSLEEIDVSTVDGPNVYFSLRFSADEDLPVLESLMAKPDFNKLHYIDFRVENRAYYK